MHCGRTLQLLRHTDIYICTLALQMYMAQSLQLHTTHTLWTYAAVAQGKQL